MPVGGWRKENLMRARKNRLIGLSAFGIFTSGRRHCPVFMLALGGVGDYAG